MSDRSHFIPPRWAVDDHTLWEEGWRRQERATPPRAIDLLERRTISRISNGRFPPHHEQGARE